MEVHEHTTPQYERKLNFTLFQNFTWLEGVANQTLITFTLTKSTTTSSPPPPTPESPTLTAFYCIIVFVITTFIVLADVTIIRSFVLHQNRRVVRNYYIFHLAVCDLLTGG